MVSYRKPDMVRGHLSMCKKYLRTQIDSKAMMDAWRKRKRGELSEAGLVAVLDSLHGEELRLKMVVHGWNNRYANAYWGTV